MSPSPVLRARALGSLLLAVLCVACTGGGAATEDPGGALSASVSTATAATTTPAPSATPVATDTPTPAWPEHARLPGDVDDDRPQLAYIDRAGDLRLVDASTGAEGEPLLSGCEPYVGVKGMPPQWSADGSTVVCWSVDGVSAARPDEPGARATPFAAGECAMLLSVSPHRLDRLPHTLAGHRDADVGRAAAGCPVRAA